MLIPLCSSEMEPSAALYRLQSLILTGAACGAILALSSVAFHFAESRLQLDSFAHISPVIHAIFFASATELCVRGFSMRQLGSVSMTAADVPAALMMGLGTLGGSAAVLALVHLECLPSVCGPLAAAFRSPHSPHWALLLAAAAGATLALAHAHIDSLGANRVLLKYACRIAWSWLLLYMDSGLLATHTKLCGSPVSVSLAVLACNVVGSLVVAITVTAFTSVFSPAAEAPPSKPEECSEPIALCDIV